MEEKPQEIIRECTHLLIDVARLHGTTTLTVNEPRQTGGSLSNSHISSARTSDFYFMNYFMDFVESVHGLQNRGKMDRDSFFTRISIPYQHISIRYLVIHLLQRDPLDKK